MAAMVTLLATVAASSGCSLMLVTPHTPAAAERSEPLACTQSTGAAGVDLTMAVVGMGVGMMALADDQGPMADATALATQAVVSFAAAGLFGYSMYHGFAKTSECRSAALARNEPVSGEHDWVIAPAVAVTIGAAYLLYAKSKDDDKGGGGGGAALQYENDDATCAPNPRAICNDGWASCSQTCSGTCSSHDGVRRWFTDDCGGLQSARRAVPSPRPVADPDSAAAPVEAAWFPADEAPPLSLPPLTKAMIRRTMERQESELDACASDDSEASEAVTVQVRLQVSAQGTVAKVEALDAPDAELGACVERALAAARFPATSNGGNFKLPVRIEQGEASDVAAVPQQPAPVDPANLLARVGRCQRHAATGGEVRIRAVIDATGDVSAAQTDGAPTVALGECVRPLCQTSCRFPRFLGSGDVWTHATLRTCS